MPSEIFIAKRGDTSKSADALSERCKSRKAANENNFIVSQAQMLLKKLVKLNKTPPVCWLGAIINLWKFFNSSHKFIFFQIMYLIIFNLNRL